MKSIWVINRYDDPNYGDIGICKSISGFLGDSGWEIRNFDFIGKKFRFQFTRTLYIIAQLFPALRDKPAYLIVGGGQLLLNNRNFPYALFGWQLVAKFSGIPLIVYSVGTERGKKESLFYRWVLKRFLQQAKNVYLRDEISAEAVYQVTGLVFDTVPDAVYLSYEKFAASKCQSIQPVVFVSLNSIPKNRIETHYARFIQAIAATGQKSVTISISSKQDVNAARGFIKYLEQSNADLIVNYEPAGSFEMFQKQIAEASVVISSRMHPIIYAHLMGKIFISLSTNQKTESMSEYLERVSPKDLFDEATAKLRIALRN